MNTTTTKADLERLADECSDLRSEMGAEIKRVTAQRDELLKLADTLAVVAARSTDELQRWRTAIQNTFTKAEQQH